MDKNSPAPESAKDSTKKEAVILKPDNSLRETIGTINLEAVISDLKLEKAKKTVQERSNDFLQTLKSEFAKIEACFKELTKNPENYKEVLEKINFIALEIKGVAGLYGYSIVPMVARSLHEFTDKIKVMDARNIKIIKVHIDTLRCILTQSREIEDTDVAKAIVEEFKKLNSL